jgi:hypothetical protein
MSFQKARVHWRSGRRHDGEHMPADEPARLSRLSSKTFVAPEMGKKGCRIRRALLRASSAFSETGSSALKRSREFETGPDQELARRRALAPLAAGDFRGSDHGLRLRSAFDAELLRDRPRRAHQFIVAPTM